MKKAALTLLVLFLAIAVGAENFIIDSYDIEITASHDSTLHIKETIWVDFSRPSHGIYRDIQYRFPNPDGNFADPVIATVSSFRSDDLFKAENEDGYYRFYLGSEDSYIKGGREYVIEYDYSLGRDLGKGYDELYYNIISPDWDTPIWNITWSVTFPEKIDSSRVWVTVGEKGSTKAGFFAVDDDGLTVYGAQGGLMNYGALTLRVEMDEGYWTGLENRKDSSSVFLVISIVLSLRFSSLHSSYGFFSDATDPAPPFPLPIFPTISLRWKSDTFSKTPRPGPIQICLQCFSTGRRRDTSKSSTGVTINSP